MNINQWLCVYNHFINMAIMIGTGVDVSIVDEVYILFIM